MPCLDGELNMKHTRRRIIIIIAINIENASLFNIFCEFILQLITILQRLTFRIFIFYSSLVPISHQSPVSQCVVVWPKGIWGSVGRMHVCKFPYWETSNEMNHSCRGAGQGEGGGGCVCVLRVKWTQ